MAVPSLPAQGSPNWFGWAQGLHNEVATGRLSDVALRAAFGSGLNVKDYGAKGDGTADDTAAITTAAAAAITQGKPLFAPAGTYIVKPAPGTIAIPLTAGITLRGAGEGRTVFKIGAGIGNWHGFIGSNTTGVDLTGLDLAGFTFDYNTGNNPLNVASLGTGSRTVVMAMRGDRIKVRDVTAVNGDGVWVVQLGGTYAAAIAAGDRCDDADVRITVDGFGGSAYHDSSAVYIIGDRMTVRGSYVSNGSPGAIAAVEVHGSNADVQVHVDGWLTGVNATGLDATTNVGGVIHDCTMRNVANGVVIWSGDDIGAAGYGIDGLRITGNDIEINGNLWAGAGKPSPPGNFTRSGVALNDMGAGSNLPMRNLSIAGNTIRYLPTTATQKTLDAGISLVRAAAMTGSPARDENIDISGNVIDSPTSAGIVVSLSNPVRNLTVHGGQVIDPAAQGIGTVGAAYATGLLLAGSFVNFASRGFSVIDNRATPLITSAVNMAGVTNGDPPTAAQTVIDPSTATPATGVPPHPVIGPPSTGGVFVRYSRYGGTNPTGRFAYGSEFVDYGNGHTFRQVVSPAGSDWQLWGEVRAEGIALGAALPDPSAPGGLPYAPLLNGAGMPSAPPTVRPGMVPFAFDVNGKLWIYVGGAWKGVATA